MKRPLDRLSAVFLANCVSRVVHGGGEIPDDFWGRVREDALSDPDNHWGVVESRMDLMYAEDGEQFQRMIRNDWRGIVLLAVAKAVSDQEANPDPDEFDAVYWRHAEGVVRAARYPRAGLETFPEYREWRRTIAVSKKAEAGGGVSGTDRRWGSLRVSLTIVAVILTLGLAYAAARRKVRNGRE